MRDHKIKEVKIPEGKCREHQISMNDLEGSIKMGFQSTIFLGGRLLNYYRGNGFVVSAHVDHHGIRAFWGNLIFGPIG